MRHEDQAGKDGVTQSGMSLCMRCGLCCTGLLFDLAPLEDDELPLAEKLHLPLACNRYHNAFQLPCPCLDDTRCAVYDTRPGVCASYECGLLRRHKAQQISLGDALADVQHVTHLVRQIHGMLPFSALARPLWDQARDHIRQRDHDAIDTGWPRQRQQLIDLLTALREAIKARLAP